MDIRQKQRAVNEFLVLGEKSPTNIFRILEKIRGDPAVAAVKKWLSRIKGEEPICQPALLSNAICRLLKSQCFYLCLVGFFLRITLMSGLLLLVTRRALLMSPKGRNASRDGLV